MIVFVRHYLLRSCKEGKLQIERIENKVGKCNLKTKTNKPKTNKPKNSIDAVRNSHGAVNMSEQQRYCKYHMLLLLPKVYSNKLLLC